MIRLLLAALLLFSASFETLALDEGTNIIGTQEAPNRLNLVDWKNVELSVDPWESTAPSFESQLLNNKLKPVDEDELRRQVEYFNLLQHSSPASD